MKNQQNDLCAQQRLVSAWACIQSNQESLLSAQRRFGSLSTHKSAQGNPIRLWVDAQADLSLCRVCGLFCWFCCSLNFK